jgi:WD40 repeat protein
MSASKLYAFRNLPGHLHDAGEVERLRSLLGSYRFLEDKISSLPPSELVADYELLPDDSALRLVQSAIRLSAHILESDPAQLPGHLRGRLLDRSKSTDIADLLEVAERKLADQLVPTTASLTGVGGPLLQTFAVHQATFLALVVTPDDQQVITGSSDSTIRVWNLATGRVSKILKGHEKGVTSLALTSNGQRVVSGSWDQSLRIWDLTTGEQEAIFSLGFQVCAVALVPDGRRILAGLEDGAVAVLDLATRTIQRIPVHQKGVRALAVTPDGRKVVSGAEDFTLRIWNLETGALEKLQEHGGPVWSVILTPAGDRAISSSRDGTIGIWSLVDGSKVATLEERGSSINSLALSRDGSRLISGSIDRLTLWDFPRLRELRSMRIRVKSLTLTSDGTRALVGNSRLTLWDLATSSEREEGPISIALSVMALALIPGTSFLVSASGRTLKIWDTVSGREIRTLTGHTAMVEAVAVTPDGRHAVSGSFDKTLKVWDLQTGEILRTLIGHESELIDLALSGDGRLAISCGIRGEVKVWNLEDGKEIHSRKKPSGYLTALAATEDGRLAVVGFQDQGDESPAIVNLATGHVVGALRGHEASVAKVLIIPGTDRILTGSFDATIRMWDLPTRRELLRLEGHTDRIRSLTVTPDGRYAVSGSDDSTLRVWNLQTGACLTVFTGDGVMTSCVITPDARLIVAGELSGNLHFFRTPFDSLRQRTRRAYNPGT